MDTWGPFSISGKRTIVTGGAMGIGYGIVRRFVEGGAKVLLVDRDEAAAHAAARKLAAPPEQLQLQILDVSDDGAPQAVVSRAVEAFGGVDVLVNNAGIYPQAAALKMPAALFDRVMQVNVRAPVFLSQAVAARMIDQAAPGKIINVCSVDSVNPTMLGMAAHDASKAALWAFTKSMALELAPRRIQVNGIAPGGVSTEGIRSFRLGSGASAEQVKKACEDFLHAKVPMGRLGQADEIATAAVFLASSASSYMTGALMVVDGGTLLT